MTGFVDEATGEATGGARGLRFLDVAQLPAEAVRDRTASALWSAAEAGGDPARAVTMARDFATDLIRRLIAGLAPGEHTATCITTGREGIPGLQASMRISADEETAQVEDEATHPFGALLMLGCLAREPVGIVVRSCPDAAHDDGHDCTVRGWVVERGRARPLTRGAIRTLAGGSLGPHPALPEHPKAEIVFATAHDLYATALGPAG